LIKINTVTISTPSTFQIGIEDISKAERNANGNLIIERITTKRKLELSYNYLSQTDIATLLTAVSGTTFTVEYPDAQTGSLRTGTFYCEGRTAGAIDYQGGVMRYKDIKFNLIEV
jgi:hypothetical protein